MIQCLFSTKDVHNTPTSIGLAIGRVFFGFSMAFAHGLGKVPPPDMLVQGLTGMGLPAPVFFAWAAGLTEFLGGILIALGLLTRPSSILMAITMAVAAFVAHGADPFQKKELALAYLASSLIFAFSGPGNFSLDALIGKKLKA